MVELNGKVYRSQTQTINRLIPVDNTIISSNPINYSPSIETPTILPLNNPNPTQNPSNIKSELQELKKQLNQFQKQRGYNIAPKDWNKLLKHINHMPRQS